MKVYLSIVLLLLLTSQCEARLQRLQSSRSSKKIQQKHKWFGWIKNSLSYWTGGSSAPAPAPKEQSVVANTKSAVVNVELAEASVYEPAPQSTDEEAQTDDSTTGGSSLDKRGANSCTFLIAGVMQDLKSASTPAQKKAICDDFNMNSNCAGYRSLRGCS